MAAPRSPFQLRARAWWATAKRTVVEFRDDGLTDWAATLTYYSVLSIFPAMIALVSMLGVVGQSATQPLLENLSGLAPGAAGDIIRGALEDIERSPGTAGIGLMLGIAGALWAASGYVGAFMRASNAIYEVEEGRPFWKLRPLQVAITALLIVLLAASALAVVITGPLAERVGDLVGAGSAAVTVWDIAKWPAIVLVVMTIFALLYYVSPNVRQPGFRWITPGGVLAVALWLAASGLFALYVANFGSYNATYGSLAAVVIFLVWLWLSNVALLLGAEFNAELERTREIAAGVPPERTLAMEPRVPASR